MVRKEKYNIVLTSSKPCSIKVGSHQIDFDGKKTFGVKDIPLEALSKLRDECNSKGILFTYVDYFYGCFKTYEFEKPAKKNTLASERMNKRDKRSKKEEIVEEPKLEEIVSEPETTVEQSVEETKEEVIEETPIEEVIENEQPSESE